MADDVTPPAAPPATTPVAAPAETPVATPVAAPGEAPEEGVTVYEAVGGMPFFQRLAAAFYEGIAVDPVLLPMYPSDDMEGAQHRLTLFLAQFWGGPLTYMEERGHPMLRARHMPFPVGPTERDHWLLHMSAAVERLTPPGEVRDAMMNYFVMAAEAMRNKDD
ncbi:MAG: globin [Actinomycetota bacterium]|nr:globin [Actinomycetota bacterium]